MMTYEEYMLERTSWDVARESMPLVYKRFNLKVGAELGVAFGNHSEHILMAGGADKIFGIDSYQHRPEYNDLMNFDQQKFDDLHCHTVRFMGEKFGPKFEMIRKSTTEAHHLFADNSLDFVYIDAEHTFEACYNDLVYWFPKVRPGGLVSGHDFSNAFRGVVDAVLRKMDEENLFLHFEAGYSWWVMKR